MDKHGRKFRKLRVSLIDACNMRCFYCMPEHPRFLDTKKLLNKNQIFDICSNLINLGIDEIRLTGGEPLLRKDFLTIVDKLSSLPLKKLALTTNAIKLDEFLLPLQQTSLSTLNISLDSLNQQSFEKITKNRDLHRIIDNIIRAKELGFKIKINTVLLKGINEHEIEDFINFSKKYEIPVRFLETMKIGEMLAHYDQYYLPVDNIIKKIQLQHTLTRCLDNHDSTSFNYILENGAQIGFIASESKPFCGTCSRLRLSATGNLYPCLFVDKGPNLIDLPAEDYPQLIQDFIHKKPNKRLNLVERPMYSIGG